MASDGKKIVKQEELRRLMREEKRRSRKRVDSPYAKYNSLGHLSCALCNIAIKSELLWPTHILGKQHKEKVSELKDAKQPAPGPLLSTSSSHVLKRKVVDSESQEIKKVKAVLDDSTLTPVSGTGEEELCLKCKSPRNNQSTKSRIGDAKANRLPTDFFDKAGETSQRVLPSKSAGLSILTGDCDDDKEGKKEDGTTDVPSPAQITDNTLPPDFFDIKTPSAPLVSHSGSILKAEIQEKTVERKENTAEALPEGFFDDPEVDAKVRKVDAPKDQMDKEWDEFQKEMRQVNTVSEAIVAEEDEEGRIDRQIDEIDEQIECYRRVEVLRDRQDMLKNTLMEAKKSKVSKEQNEEETGSDDEEELQVLLSQDWRVKGTLL